MTRIVCIGECMVEMAPTGADGTYRMGFAGDTMNTAWYLRRQMPGGAVDYLTAVGTDAVSDAMVAFLGAAGIGTAQVQRRADRTVGLYLIQLAGAERSFAYWRGQSAARTLAEDAAALDDALTGADIAYLSGITLAILPEADRVTLLSALARLRRGGGRVVFDPNLRPALWSSPDEMTRAVTEAAEVADIVLPSFEDEAQWFGDASPEATALRYGGAGLVVVKNGPGEIVTRQDDTITAHPAVKASRIVDTTAAGDSFNAGFLAAHLAGSPLSEAIRAGADLAARVIGHRGALMPPGS